MNMKYLALYFIVTSLLCVTSSINQTSPATMSEMLSTTSTTTTTASPTPIVIPSTTTTSTTTTTTTAIVPTTTTVPTITTTKSTTTTNPTSTSRMRTSLLTTQQQGVTSTITTETSMKRTNSTFEFPPLVTAKGRSQLSTRPTQLHGPHLLPNESIFQAVHTALTIIALACNCISLMVIYGIVPKLTPPLRLLTSLAFCDMLAPWAIMTLYFSRSACQDEIHTSVLLAAHNAAALTLISLALIHNIATFRPLHYERIASSKNIWTVVGVVWVMSLILAHVHFIVSAFDRNNNNDNTSFTSVVSAKNTTISPSSSSSSSSSSTLIGPPTYCERIESSTSIALIISGFLCVLAVLSGVIIYSRILLHLRPVDAFLTPHSTNSPSEGLSSSRGAGLMASSRHSTRGVLTGVVLLAGYALTWLPYLVVKYVSVEISTSDYAWPVQISPSDITQGGSSSLTDDAAVQVAVGVCQTLLIIGCIVNPVVCGSRMTCLQIGYSQLVVRCRIRLVRAWIGCRRRIRRYRGDDDEVPTTPLNQISESLCY